MTLLDKFRQSKGYKPADLRRYGELIRENDPKNADEFLKLCHALDKNASDVETDLKTIQKATALAGAIKEGLGTEAAIEAMSLEVAQHDAETRRLTNARKSEVQPMYDRRAQLVQASQVARESITALHQLVNDHPHILAGFPIASESELK